MFSRFGLRFRMATSYVLVSAAAVLLVEAVLLAVTIGQIRDANRDTRVAQQRAAEAEANVNQLKVDGIASLVAKLEGDTAAKAAARSPGRADAALLAEAAADGLGEPDPASGGGQGGKEDPAIALLQVLTNLQGQVVATSPPGVLAAGSTIPAEAIGSTHNGGPTQMNGQAANWAAAPVEIPERGTGRPRAIGIVYVVLQGPPPDDKDTGKAADAAELDIGSLATPGVIILVLLLPVGALFGMLSTGRLIRRIRRLATGTTAMAAGDLQTRIPVESGDEVGRLEQAFNSMASRLDAALEVQRRAAGSEAQRAERARIARELHDSISQDLFSVSLVAGGLRKALPAGSELYHQAESMERSLARTMREMRAMLLELRPIALEDTGLAEALEELCRAYRSRLGITLTVRIDEPLRLSAPVEHAVFRVVQESVGNAIRHGEPGTIDLWVTTRDGRVTVTVTDDGRGFAPQSPGDRHGMGLDLMRERIAELGGTVEVSSAPGRGTTVTAALPVGEPERTV